MIRHSKAETDRDRDRYFNRETQRVRTKKRKLGVWDRAREQ